MARLLRSNIQDFVQEVPVGQMAQGTLFSVLAVTPFQKHKWEVKPPKCPTRHPRVGGYPILPDFICNFLLGGLDVGGIMAAVEVDTQDPFPKFRG